MATDIGKAIGNLLAFYDFRDKAVISVGAGGGQFIEYGRQANKVLAVDTSAEALEKLKERLVGAGLADKFTLVHSDFYRCDLKGDVVMFEFCLHEMPDPAAALEHSTKMAADILVLDHWPESEWAFYVSEEDKVARSWQALRSFPCKKIQKYEATQFFKNYEELRQKVSVMGETSINRIRPFIHSENFSIPMSYGFAWI